MLLTIAGQLRAINGELLAIDETALEADPPGGLGTQPLGTSPLGGTA